MNLSDIGKEPDINREVTAFQKTENAVLLDVRTAQEYEEGHIPDSINIPLDELVNIEQTISKKETPLFVYCHSGGRSSLAVEFLHTIGYTNAKNIGGIISYKGETAT